MSAAVTRGQRFTRSNPCPVCGGHEQTPRGQEKRCHGYVSTDGEYVHCAREEHAGGIASNGAGLFAHRRRGRCNCGTVHEPAEARPDAIEAAYPYNDEGGALLFEVVRKTGKRFLQRRPDGNGGWIWKLDGVRRVLYRLPELAADDANRTVFIVEGEKDADTLAAHGFLATCNPGGAGKWSMVADLAREVLAGRAMVVVADKDEPGRRHAREVADSLRDVAASVRLCECSKGKDVSDLYSMGGEVPSGLVDTVDREASAAPGVAIDVPAAWYSERPPARTWLLRDVRRPDSRGVLPLGKVGQLIAEGGAGKTMALCQLAVAVATGTAWLGAFGVQKPGRVLLALGEEDAEEAQRRLYAARAASPAVRAPEPGAIVVMPLAGVAASMLELDDRGNLVETPWLTEFRSYVRAGDFRLVVVDPLSRFAGPTAEKDNAAGTRFVQALESLVSPTSTVLNGHHTNKGARGANGKVDGTSGRGSTSLYDGARWQCVLETVSTRAKSRGRTWSGSQSTQQRPRTGARFPSSSASATAAMSACSRPTRGASSARSGTSGCPSTGRRRTPRTSPSCAASSWRPRPRSPLSRPARPRKWPSTPKGRRRRANVRGGPWAKGRKPWPT